MANQNELKQENILSILKAIRNNCPITKPEIAKITNLTSVTAHNFINELVFKNLVKEVGFAKSHGGRKAALYTLNADFSYILGQNLGRNIISTTVYNINLDLLYNRRIKYENTYSDKIISVMAEEIEQAILSLKLTHDDFLGIGISVPGQVNHESGVIINITEMPEWNGVSLKEIIEEKTGIYTFVDNDNNAAAVAIKWNRLVQDNSDTVCISIGDGVGTGILTKGRLFYGSHSYAGEFGHTTIQYDGPVCKCGNQGCIEAIISDFALIEKVQSITGLSYVSDIASVVKLAKGGNKEVSNVLTEIGKLTSIAVEHIVKIIDPDFIVIQSSWINEFLDIQYLIIDNVFNRCVWAKRDILKILFNKMEHLENTGPSALILEKCFQLSRNNILLERLN